MMTNKQHDDAWLNVMEKCVPEAKEYIRDIAMQMRVANTLKYLELKATLPYNISNEGSLKEMEYIVTKYCGYEKDEYKG